MTRFSGGSARLGNVSAFRAGSAPAADVLARCFTDVGSLDGGLAAWIAAIEAAPEERVLVATGEADLESLQAVLCWPEADALVFDGALVLLLRDAVLPSARDAVARGVEDPFAWLDAIAAERVDREALGLGDTVREAC